MPTRALSVLLDLARAAGAHAAEALAVTCEELVVTTLRGRPVPAPPLPPRREVWLRVWTADGRSAKGRVVADGVPRLLQEASAGLRRPGPVARASSHGPGLSLLDRRHGSISPDDRAEAVLFAERTVRGVDRSLAPVGFTYSERLRTREYRNTRGVAARELDTVYTCAGAARATDGTERRDRVRSRSFSTIASVPLGAELARWVADLGGAATAHRGPVSVALPARAAAALVDGVASRLASGDLGFLADGPLDPRLHVLDDGQLPGGLRTASFDDAGVRPRALLLLREGRVDGGYRSGGDAPTGHDRGPGLRPTNLLLRPGARPLEQALRERRGPVLVLEDGLWGAATADGAVDTPVVGSLWSGPQRVGAVRGARLVGDLGAALRRGVEVCGEAERVGHVDTPPLLLDGFELRDAVPLSAGGLRATPGGSLRATPAPPR